jgi:hypothetical protein
MRGNEKCVGANSTEPTTTNAFVWSDETCTIMAAFMCRIEREWRSAVCVHPDGELRTE